MLVANISPQPDEVFPDPSFNTVNEPQALPAACKHVPLKASYSRRKNLQTPVSAAEIREKLDAVDKAMPIAKCISDDEAGAYSCNSHNSSGRIVNYVLQSTRITNTVPCH